LITDLKKCGFSLKVTKQLTDYLSCRIFENESRDEILILQPHLINNLKDKFEEEVAQKRDYKLLEHRDLELFYHMPSLWCLYAPLFEKVFATRPLQCCQRAIQMHGWSDYRHVP
jgi:hypothetical protein